MRGYVALSSGLSKSTQNAGTNRGGLQRFVPTCAAARNVVPELRDAPSRIAYDCK